MEISDMELFVPQPSALSEALIRNKSVSAMRDRMPLFSMDSLDENLRSKSQQAMQAVDDLPEQQFLVATDEQIIESISARRSVTPLVLHEDLMTMQQSEMQVDVAGDWRKDLRNHRGPYYVPGTRVEIMIPYTGQQWLFQYKTNPFNMGGPTGEPSADDDLSGKLRIAVSAAHDVEPEYFKQQVDAELKQLRLAVQRSGAQVTQYNEALSHLVREAVRHRRERLKKHDSIAALLNIPVVVNPKAPSITPVKIEIRKPPPLPVVPKTGLKPEPGIDPQTYELILQFIRHQGRTFEATPGTFSKFDEEELRDITLAHLNGHFRGGATGETFRRHGKTDIRIEQEDRAAFVGECKVWAGEKGATDAINQLLSYLTWRDGKSALVMFNKTVKGFSTVLETLPAAILRHPHFIQPLDCQEDGEWRMLMRSSEDEGRRVTLHVFAFNIFVEKGPRIRRL